MVTNTSHSDWRRSRFDFVPLPRKRKRAFLFRLAVARCYTNYCSMKRSFKKTLQRLLSRFHLGIFRLPAGNFRKGYRHLTAQYEDAVKEICGYFQKFVFKDFSISGEEIKLINQLYGTGISEALYLIHYLRPALALEGDVCEFGTAEGATSALLAHEIIATNKNLWLFDTFRGLPKPTSKDVLVDDPLNLGSIEKYEGTM